MYQYEEEKYYLPENFIEYLNEHYLADRQQAFEEVDRTGRLGAYNILVIQLGIMFNCFIQWAKENQDKVSKDEILLARGIVEIEERTIKTLATQGEAKQQPLKNVIIELSPEAQEEYAQLLKEDDEVKIVIETQKDQAEENIPSSRNARAVSLDLNSNLFGDQKHEPLVSSTVPTVSSNMAPSS